MKNPFDQPQINQRISEFESKTGYELIVAAAHSSDPYPGAAWRGATLLSLLISACILHFWSFEPRSLEILLVGVITLVLVFILRKFRLHYYFAIPSEMERETLQEAQATYSYFQSESHGHHASILFYLSLREHKIHVLTSQVLKLDELTLKESVSRMSQNFKKGSFAVGLVEAIDILETKILQEVGKNQNPEPFKVADRVFWKEE